MSSHRGSLRLCLLCQHLCPHPDDSLYLLLLLLLLLPSLNAHRPCRCGPLRHSSHHKRKPFSISEIINDHLRRLPLTLCFSPPLPSPLPPSPLSPPPLSPLPSPSPPQFHPTAGPVDGGTEVTVIGSNLGASAEDIVRVTIGSVNCSITSIMPGVRSVKLKPSESPLYISD